MMYIDSSHSQTIKKEETKKTLRIKALNTQEKVE